MSSERHPGRIGIITGSGPEAGLDLWSKVLRANRERLGEGYLGDVSAPYTVIFSVPRLGLSMDLEQHEERLRDVLADTALAIREHVDCFAIACNTLNYYEPFLRSLVQGPRFISVGEVVAHHLAASKVTSVALLGASPALDLERYSPYRDLPVAITLPSDVDALHALIHEVKLAGEPTTELRARFAELLRSVEADVVLLACTELPLIAEGVTSHTLVDVTDLLAQGLVDFSLDPSSPRWRGGAAAVGLSS